jgi:hypothetical protein
VVEEEEHDYEFEPEEHGVHDGPGRGRPHNELARIEAFLRNLERFMDALFDDPPPGLKGEWLDEQRNSWNEISAAQVAGGEAHSRHRLSTTIAHEPGVAANLDAHGLTGQPLSAKLGEFRDKVRDYLRLKNVRRASYALRTAAVLVESVLEAIPGVGGAYKEAVKLLHHLTEIALEEGS